jgi:hypothetical protein
LYKNLWLLGSLPARIEMNTGLREDTMEEHHEHHGKHMHRGAYGGAAGGAFWFAGWLFTISFANLVWWKIILGIVVWPLFLGWKLAG